MNKVKTFISFLTTLDWDRESLNTTKRKLILEIDSKIRIIYEELHGLSANNEEGEYQEDIDERTIILDILKGFREVIDLL